jgi:hypothetical protein
MHAMSVRADDLSRLTAGSHQHAARRVHAFVEAKFGDGANLLASFSDKVIVVHEDRLACYAVEDGGLGGEIDMDVEYLDAVGEAVELRRLAKASLVSLFEGRRHDFESGLVEVVRGVSARHVMAESAIDTTLENTLSDDRGWLRLQTERAPTMRKFLRGVLGELDGRRFRPQFKSVYDGTAGAATEDARHAILPALQALSARLKEQEALLATVGVPQLGELAPEHAELFDIVSGFGTTLADDVGALRYALESKLRLAGRTAAVQNLARLHDSLAERVNQIDFATKFYERACSQIQETQP